MSGKRTIERLWRDAVTAGRQTPAYLVQHGDHWHELSWSEAADRVETYANGLLSLGVRRGDGVHRCLPVMRENVIRKDSRPMKTQIHAG